MVDKNIEWWSQFAGQRAQYVAEPIVRQQLVAVRPAVQQFAVAQPAIQAVRQVAVAQPAIQAFRQVAVAQPQFQAVRQIAVAQPQFQTVSYAQPQFQTLSYAQPQFQAVRYAQPLVQQLAVPQSVAFGVQPVGVAQQVVGVNRVVANEPSVVRTEEVREVRPQVSESRGSDFVKYVESNQ